MIRKLTALTLVGLGALTACSDSEETSESTSPEKLETQDAESGSNTDSGNTDGTDDTGTEETMVVEGDTATSSDGRYSFTLSEGWQAYPAPLGDNVNISVLLVASVNNAEFVPNVVGTWLDDDGTLPETYEDWAGQAEEVLGGEGVEVSEPDPIEIDGESVRGVQVTQTVDGIDIVQVVYLLIAEDGVQELAFATAAEDFETNIEDAKAMMESMTANN